MTTSQDRYYTSVTCPVGGCVLTSTHRHPDVVYGSEVLEAIAKATDEPAYVAQTGGGTATIYIGTPDDDVEGRYLLAIGPGTYHWDEPGRSLFYLGDDLYIGPDDNGENIEAVRGAESLDELTTAVRELLANQAAALDMETMPR